MGLWVGTWKPAWGARILRKGTRTLDGEPELREGGVGAQGSESQRVIIDLARSWTSWWARTPTTTRRRRSAATTAASASAWSRTCWRPARVACSPTVSTWVGPDARTRCPSATPPPLPSWERETLRPAGLLPLSLPGSELLLSRRACGTGRGCHRPVCPCPSQRIDAGGWEWSLVLSIRVLMSKGMGRLGDSSPCRACHGLVALS